MLIATMNDPNAQVKLKSCYALESFAENLGKLSFTNVSVRYSYFTYHLLVKERISYPT